MMTESNVARTIAHLRATVAYHEKAYRTRHEPEISDTQFNALKDELRKLLDEYPEYELAEDTAVGDDTVAGRQIVPHASPMLSLYSTMSLPLLLEWVEALMLPLPPDRDHRRWAINHKLDGVALDLTYENNVLTQASLRGNGLEGEDVLVNALVIEGIPHRLHQKGHAPPVVCVRGEVIVERGRFESHNLKADEDKTIRRYTSPRSMAAAAMRYVLPEMTKALRPSFIAYGAIGLKSSRFEAIATWLDHNGFTVVPTQFVDTVQEVREQIEAIGTERLTLPYDIDGAVIALTHVEHREQIGASRYAPHWAKAFKYPSATGVSTVADIAFQVARTGIVTPVLKVVPVSIGEITVRSITLHNAAHLERYALAVGDTVVIRRANDVGPQFVRSIPKGEHPPIAMTTTCPSCQTALVGQAGDPIRRCPNVTGCPAQRLHTFLHLCSSRGLNVVGFGQHRLCQLLEAGLLSTPADLFRLQANDLCRVLGVTETYADALIEAVAVAKWTTLPRLLVGLGIEGVGVQLATILSQAFDYDLDALLTADAATLGAIDDIGPIRAQALVGYMAANRHALHDLIAQGVRWNVDAPRPSEVTGPLEGQHLLVSGRVHNQQRDALTREEVHASLAQHGATLFNHVAAKLDALLIGERPSPIKIATAVAMRIPVMTVNEYLISKNLPPL